jgi:hypothetical protein
VVALFDVNVDVCSPYGGRACRRVPAPPSMSGLEISVGEEATAKVSGNGDVPEKVTGMPAGTLTPYFGASEASKTVLALMVSDWQSAAGVEPIVRAWTDGAHHSANADRATTTQEPDTQIRERMFEPY